MEIHDYPLGENRNPKDNPNGIHGMVLTDGSKIITESLVCAGADVFIGYPITPSNLFYSYAKKRFPSFYAAPDEISTLQWMAGFSATGKLPVSATSFPGLALMTESLNMAFMMELPMVLIVAQRLGPSTGSATIGAEGDLLFINGLISGGYSIPVLCPSNFEDCWKLGARSLEIAVKLRTPVILLTTKEMVMTNKSFDLSYLEDIKPVHRERFKGNGKYKSYDAGSELVPAFEPLGNSDFQVRMNASTHDNEGFIRNGDPESLANTKRLRIKIENKMKQYTYFDWKRSGVAERLLVTYGISSDAAREALIHAGNKEGVTDLLIIKTLLPVSEELYDIFSCYKELVFIEENLSGQLKEIIFGKRKLQSVRGLNKIGSMISPNEIMQELA